MRQHWPVGARDGHPNCGAAGCSHFSGCYTLTLAPLCPVGSSRGGAHRARVPIMVDVPKDVAHLVPGRSARAIEVSHKTLDALAVSSQMTRYHYAFRRLQRYACDASIVITSRLHAALPALASVHRSCLLTT